MTPTELYVMAMCCSCLSYNSFLVCSSPNTVADFFVLKEHPKIQNFKLTCYDIQYLMEVGLLFNMLIDSNNSNYVILTMMKENR